MEDKSYLDKKYFVDNKTYNCSFCNRRNLRYDLKNFFKFDWNNNKKCFVYFVQCSSCEKISMHLSYEEIHHFQPVYQGRDIYVFDNDVDIDSKIFYSVPTSFFVLDSRIPRVIRELITEAEGCLKMNFFTGASACMRKAVYELLITEKAEGDDYESRIKFLKKKYPNSDPELFDILAHIQGMTSDKIHEQSWDKWNSPNLKLIIETLKTVLYEIYVLPKIKTERAQAIKEMRKVLLKDKKLPAED